MSLIFSAMFPLEIYISIWIPSSGLTAPRTATALSVENPWHNKGKQNESILQRLKSLPGEIAHTHIMTSSVPVLTPQIVGFLGLAKFQHASFFYDRSDYTFSNHQSSTSADGTIKAKHDYEEEIRKYGKEVQHCHAENGTYDVAQHCKDI